MQVIDKFDGEYAFLSNFYFFPMCSNRTIFKTVEHYFQAYKAITRETFERIVAQPTPGLAKREGRMITLRKDWDTIKDQIMLEGLQLKFSNWDLREQLLATGDAILIEGNTWHDNYWGNCTCERCKDIEGKNHLGTLLMQVREEIKTKEREE